VGSETMKSIKQFIFKSSDGLSLVGELNRHDKFPEGICILCHPHPLYGGNMYTAVIDVFWKNLPRSGFLTFRFNFRGVEGSEGCHEEGTGETQDIHGAVTFLIKQGYQDIPFFLVGYSFGAYVTHHLEFFPEQVKGVCLVSPPVSMMPFDFPDRALVPHLIMSGDTDVYCNLSILRSKLENGDRRITLVPFTGTDHFWSGKEINLVKKFGSWSKTILEGALSSP